MTPKFHERLTIPGLGRVVVIAAAPAGGLHVAAPQSGVDERGRKVGPCRNVTVPRCDKCGTWHVGECAQGKEV